MVLMLEKVKGGLCHAIHRYAKENNKHMGQNYDKSIELSYLPYMDANNLYGWQCVKTFLLMEDLSRFNEHIIKNYYKNSDKGYIFEVDVQYPKNLFNSHKDLPFLPEKRKSKKLKSLFVI